MFFVYIIFSENINKFYIGQTMDVAERFREHNSGKFTGAFTLRANDWKLFLTIQCISRSQAIRIENHIKNMKSKTYIENLKKYPIIIQNLLIKYQ
ncbi:MAG: GIY-YIG nuclease family protein [Bacteroidales bacterium]|nr:GIY-YIG nuclease family protein [Bacteroidales bacterium]